MIDKDDKQFWLIVRRALLMLVEAIEVRYEIGKHSPNSGQRAANND
jgi:hypothetical protein